MDELYVKGLENLKKIDGEAGEEVVHALDDVSPDLGRLIVEVVFGMVYDREILELKEKEIGVVAGMTAMGLKPQLKVHLNAALNVGCSIAECHEIVLQMSGYAGFPATIEGMKALKEVMTERTYKGVDDTRGEIVGSTRTGEETLSSLDPNQAAALEASFAEFPDLPKMIIQFYGDVMARPALSLRHRQIATCAALCCLGKTQQLGFHIRGALNLGITKEELADLFMLMAIIAGFPAAINATFLLRGIK